MNWRAFLGGMASISIYQPPIKRRGFQDDAEALRHDWEMVGQDMRKAIERFERKHPDLTREREERRDG